jgi:predicted DNA-binding transcriptional regulator AlpA
VNKLAHTGHVGNLEIKPTIPFSIANFDSLPNSAQVDLSCLKALTSKSRATIYRWIDLGFLPKPKKIGTSRNLWSVGDIRRALSIQR